MGARRKAKTVARIPSDASLGSPGRADLGRRVLRTAPIVRVVVNDDVKALAQGRNFAALSTLLPSGQPQTHVVWIDCDDEHLLINTEVELRKFKNVEADPRVTVTIWNKDNPYFFAEVRGRVVETVTGPQACAHIDALARKYTGADYSDDLIRSERVILSVRPESQIVFARDARDQALTAPPTRSPPSGGVRRRRRRPRLRPVGRNH